jgi:hypothetical protein
LEETMVFLYLSIILLVTGVVLLLVGYIANASNDRKILSAETIIESQKKEWVEDFSQHLHSLFSEPCPTCKTPTLLAEGITTEVRTNESPIENFIENTLITTQSFHRYCPNCEKILDQPAPMEAWHAESISQNRAFDGGEPLKIVQIHQKVDEIINHFAENNLDSHDLWHYQPDSKQRGYEKLLEGLKNKAIKYSMFVVLGWILIPIGLVLFFFWVIL